MHLSDQQLSNAISQLTAIHTALAVPNVQLIGNPQYVEKLLSITYMLYCLAGHIMYPNEIED